MQLTGPALLTAKLGTPRNPAPLHGAVCRRPPPTVRPLVERKQSLQAVSNRDKRARYRDFTNQDSVEYWAIDQSRWIEEANKARAKQLEQLQETKEQLQKVKAAADKTKQASRIIGKLWQRCKTSKSNPITKIEQHRQHWRQVEEVMDYHRIAWYQRPRPKSYLSAEQKAVKEVEAADLMLHDQSQKTLWSIQRELMSVNQIAKKLQDPDLTHREQELLSLLLQMTLAFDKPLDLSQTAESGSNCQDEHLQQPITDEVYV